MKTRAERHKKILELVSGKPVRTQAELRRRLLRRGIRVNQATLSRDVRLLGLVKVSAGEGAPRYAPVEEISPLPRARTDAVIGRLVRDVEPVRSLVVVKTEPGGASPLGLSIDRLGWQEVAGTVAGDDTLLVIARGNAGARKVARKIEGMRK